MKEHAIVDEVDTWLHVEYTIVDRLQKELAKIFTEYWSVVEEALQAVRST